jgi:hypothetical protein
LIVSDQLFRPPELPPPDPTGRPCERCGKPATVAKAITKPAPLDPKLKVDSGLRVYACSACEEWADEMVARPMGRAGGVLGKKAA